MRNYDESGNQKIILEEIVIEKIIVLTRMLM